jgi:hypothetical protein
MGRLPRAIDDGLVYQAFNRGNNRDDVFADDADHVAFLQAIADANERYPFRLFGYCLMTNHFHLLWWSFPHHGLGHADPLVSGFPEWDELGGTEAQRRRRWRAKVRGVQDTAKPPRVRARAQTGCRSRHFALPQFGFSAT